MAASDDPLYLGLRGGAGREFRLSLSHGRSLRRGAEDRYILAPAGQSNVEHTDLNDPTSPQLEAGSVDGVYLSKGFDPIPNVRAVGELDDRLEIVEAEVEIHADGLAMPDRFFRQGPIWLGLVSGLRFELPRLDAG